MKIAAQCGLCGLVQEWRVPASAGPREVEQAHEVARLTAAKHLDESLCCFRADVTENGVPLQTVLRSSACEGCRARRALLDETATREALDGRVVELRARIVEMTAQRDAQLRAAETTAQVAKHALRLLGEVQVLVEALRTP